MLKLRAHNPQKSSSGLCTMLKLRALVTLTVSQSLFLSAVVSTTAFIGDSRVEYAQL